MKQPILIAATIVLAAALLGGCNKTQPPAPDKFAELQARLAKLEGRLGPDSCLAPEIDGIIRELEAIPETSPHFTDAVALAGTLKAKRRAGLQAIDERNLHQPWKEAPRVPSFGPMRVEGEQPKAQDAAARVDALKVGDSRAHLVETFGSCLVRQTWFRGTNGAATVELFHVAPDCRNRFKPRIYKVSADKIDSITSGNLDSIMTETRPSISGRQ